MRPLSRCLESLQRHLPAATTEVIILLNGASPDVVDYVNQCVGGARIISSDVNLGFAGGCNRAAAHARGEYVVLLNDDTEIEPGWLEALVETADAHPNAGVVGSRVLFPNGSLQEAGCVIWNDGSTMPIGRNSAPGSSAYMYRRPVDYCSACSLLVRRSVWDALGGMDESYYPAYYEDVDFCLRVVLADGAILYQPRSRVYHLESASTDERFKQFVFARSRQRFIEKWRHELVRFEDARPTSPASVQRAIHRAEGSPRRILVVDDRVPDLTWGSGFARMDQALQELTDRARVSFYASAEPSPDPRRLGERGIETLDHRLETHLSLNEVLYDAVLISRPHNYARYAETVRRLQPQATLLYDAESLFWRRLARREALTGERDLSSSARELECRIAREADRVLCISPTEAQWFRASGARRVQMIPPFWPATEPSDVGVGGRQGMLFVAGWLAGADSPNGDGLTWFVREVLPRVRRSLPAIRLDVTGDVPESIRNSAGDALRLLGRVPSLEPLYSQTRVVVAPVRFGAGVKLKVIEAVQHGVPVVTTSVGAEGIQLPVTGAVRAIDNPVGFADAVIELLTDTVAWRAQREAALRLDTDWRRRYTPGRWAAAIEHAVLERDPTAIVARVSRQPPLA